MEDLSNIKLDTRPGYYYASIRDGDNPSRFGFLAGPFDKHQTALDILPKAKDKAIEIDGYNYFHGFGTCRLPPEFPNPPKGKLNDLLGI